MGTAHSQGVDGTWTGGGSEWTTGTNWSSTPAVPTGTATFTNNGAPTAVTISNNASIDTMNFLAAAPAYSFTIGNAATFTVTGGTANASTFNPAFAVGAGATLAFGNGVFAEIGALSGGGTVALGTSDPSMLLSIAGSSNSTFSGKFSGAGSLEFNSTGTTTFTGAGNGGNIGTIGGDLILCNCSAGGGLTIDGGALNVTGLSEGISVFGGTLSVINGGTLNTGLDLLVADTMVVSGAGSSVTVAGFTGVGIFDPGTLTISAGGVLNSQSGAEIDSIGPGTSQATVTGRGSTWNVGGAGLAVGGASTGGPGALTISAGGTVNVSNIMTIGDAGPGTSAAMVTGAGSVLNVQTALEIGDPCDCLIGTLTVADGGTVNSPGFTGIGAGSTLNLGTGGLAGSIITPAIDNRGQIVANFTDTLTLAADISGGGSVRKLGTGKLTLTGNNSYTGGTTIGAGTIAVSSDTNLGDVSGGLTLGLNLLGNPGGTLETTASFASARAITLNSGGGTIATNSGVTTTLTGVIDGGGPLTKAGIGTLVLTGTNTYTGGTRINGGTLAISADANLGGAGGTLTFNGGTLQTTASFASARSTTLNAGGGTFNTDAGVTTTLSGTIDGTGALFKTGLGTLTLDGAKTYTGGTVVNAGTLRLGAGGALAATGALVVNGGTFDLNGNNQMVALLAGGGGTVALGSGTLTVNQAGDSTYGGTLTGAGSLFKTGSGTLTLSGANTYTGPTTVNVGRLAVNGSITSNVTVFSLGNLGGSGTIFGSVTNFGTLAPGNSIGTLTVSGSYTQAPGSTYQVEVNAAGQGDRLNVVGAPGTATIQGGTVQVLAQPGSYGRNTTYTILNATGGVSGTYSNVTSNFAFLTPSLLYDANNVFLNLYLSSTAFASGAQTVNQFAVGTALDRGYGAATGDFATVLGVLTGLSTAQGPAALDALSGQNYAGFGTANVQGGLAYMNVVGQQMSLARGGSGGGSRMALAQACEVACDADSVSPFSVWGSAVGGTGSVAGNGNSSTLTYNLGGFATGIDYRVDPRILAGLSLGYGSGNQWLGGFNGRGTSDSYNVAAYASFTPGAFYIDALAGYGYNDNTLTRVIAIPGLASRTAMGKTGANQFTGQAEAGYRFDVYAPAMASVTPFARFQTMNVGQNAFTETGANSLNLSVAQQTTTSVRTVLGAELQGALDMGLRDKLALQLRLGWSYEYADVSRPVSASFAGAPGIGYTVYGATPQRSGAVLGLAANTAIAQNTSIYLRYDGEFGTGTDNHVLSAGLRMNW